MTKRTRNWATICYDDFSIFLPKLDDLKVDYIVSPLHDRDIDPLNQLKKAHYHVILLFSSVKSEDQVRDLISTFDGVGLESVNSIRGYARYLCHLDNPEKAQYDVNDVYCSSSSVDYFGLISLPTDKYDAIGDMMDWVDRESCISFARLLRYARDNNNVWFRSLCDNSTIVMREFIKSRTWELDNDRWDAD